jgi:16S rRNA G527 N7-methylase RsmG
VIVSRALGPVEAFVRMALPLLAAEGRIVAMRGRTDPGDLRALAHAAESGGWGARLRFSRRGYRIPGLAAERCLLVFERVAA